MLQKLLNTIFKTFFIASILLSMTSCAKSAPSPHSTPVPRRIFTDLRVYSATPGTLSQYYDSGADKILGENIWVLRSDGTYSAIVNVDGKAINLSGVYSGDDTGHGFIFSIETNNDNTFDESLYTDDNFSFIEWRRESGTLRYYLVK